MGFISLLFSEWTILIGTLLFIFYKWSTSTYDFFKKKDVPYVKPIPFFGNLFRVVFQMESFFENVRSLYDQFKDKKFFGIFEMRNPLLVINDPDLIKQVTVKDFDHFVNHRVILDSESEPLFGLSLFSLQDQKWKDMRATLSPAFTGSKMRMMYSLIDEVSSSAVGHLKEELKVKNSLVVDMKEFCTRFTNDVIASAAFGVTINSLAEKDNTFYKMGRKATNFSGLTSLKFFLFSNCKQLMKLLKIRLFDVQFSNYFRHLVLDTIKYRTDHGVVRPDMINLLLEARKGVLKHEQNQSNGDDGFAATQESTVGVKTHNRNWSDDEIVAQCFLFFIAGFETTSILICFCAHELMENPEVQRKLLDEIDQVNAELDGKPLSYEALQKMKYLDMVLSETLRKWPAAIATDRVCVKPYVLNDSSTGQIVNVNVGDILWIPIVGLHFDPKHYPNPNQFDPERFNDENKGKINPFTYLPFGVGPRNCIGSRFALLETKALIFKILTEFSFEVSPKTTIPIVLSKSGFQLQPKGGFWLELKPRK